jgi:hypothetical protein
MFFGVQLFSVCFLCLRFKMTKFDFHTQVNILISDVMKTLLQYFAVVMMKLLIYLNTMLSWHIVEKIAA